MTFFICSLYVNFNVKTTLRYRPGRSPTRHLIGRLDMYVISVYVTVVNGEGER